ncbi:hypothetical protein BU24DRAFT_407044 [Aaosphaeria arxii CBS 175.79]|uniref:Uncharacterized protein n=1 Tax=Aaosphaeria arxii CBS 175.79 TaxID=1450172 RepID=A0A6A5XUB8_9PLEO|nr:uncharacterized protein BU24DRAFT_407044 [Aaosphaeria arxii CBS 175.79]KAF2016955.1 hypothetical protein BU24DRAFT_407044 [Aaosphaeria arxii CBS 175.79]
MATDDLFGLLAGMEAIMNLNRAQGFTKESVNALMVGENLIPSSTVYLFFDFAFEGNLPNGDRTKLPLLLEDEVPLSGNPYASWAPAPYNQTSSCSQERILAAYRDPNRNFVASIERRISNMRARLWEGQIPMTGKRWKEKRLDEFENWQPAFEFLFEIIHTFMWLGDPVTQRGIKENFNFIAQELEILQAALNMRRAQKGFGLTINLTGLWLEWIHAVFETMSTRTHSWMAARVEEIVAKGKARYDAAVARDGAENSRDAAKKLLEAWSDLSRLVQKADFMVMMPMDDFIGFTPSRFPSKVAGTMFPMPFRDDECKEMSANMSWPVSERLLDNLDAVYTNKEDIEALMVESKEQHQIIRTQLRGEPRTLGPEHWITIIKSRTEWSLSHGGPRDQTWGYVAYNLTHRSKEEWAAFLTKLHADFREAGQWVEGFEDIRANMGLQWVDGQAKGFSKNSILAAKRHFAAFRNSPDCRRRAWKHDFLVVDDECFDSYMKPPVAFQETAPYGDYGGYVKLIDTSAYDPRLIAATAPGYPQQLRVLGTLIFDDVYPLMASLGHRPRDLWPSAVLHPNQVYVGHPVPVQQKSWEQMWKVREIGRDTFIRWQREQQTQTQRR